MIFYTADLHLGHANVIRHCERPFQDADEMDEELIERWNRKVHKNDTVYIVGDFIFRCHRPPEEYFDLLKGKKHLILGNHDKYWLKKVDTEKFLESVSPMLYISDSGHPVVMCHYPMLIWPGVGRGGYMVYGHIHNNVNMDYWPLLAVREQMLNAGTDINGFEPVTLEEMIRNNRKFKQENAVPADIEQT